MGQQQLLLIVLGVIIVGIAIVVGINLFTAGAEEANKDGITADLVNLASMAQQHYRKPAAMGGGDNTFTGFTIPTQLASTANGTYAAVVAAQTVAITGTPLDATYNWTIVTTVTPNNVATVFTPGE
jgi:Tfp pilus assembly protein PilE